MNRTKLKNYAPQARRDFIQAMTDRAAFYGLTAGRIEPIVERGDIAVIAGREHPRAVVKKRRALEERIARDGFERTMEALAYTWFNRLVAIRYMELHGYLEHGYRVLSHPEGKATPEILEHAEHIELPGIRKEAVIDLKLAGNRESELYRLLLTAQCNALQAAMPFLFERIDDETELLLPDNLLHSDSLIRKLVGEIDEKDWQEVEIIGWLYQFYISEKKDEVIGKVVASEDIPAATQLFTPNWIVKYLVQNTLGRQWLATYPQSALLQQMDYYIEPAEQTPEVQEQLKAITPTSLNPEELTLLDPACGSGHILVEAYDLFKAIYQERGYRAKDIPALILHKNLFGLEIDDRAAQLAAFALMMKARADDRRIFDSEAKPNVVAIQDSKGLKAADITHALTSPINKEDVPKEYLFEEIQEEKDGLFSKKALAEKGHVSQADIASLAELFENAKTFGSLIQIPPNLAAKLPEIEKRVDDVLKFGDLTHASAHVLKPLLQQARLLARQYDAVVANPPYMGNAYFSPDLKQFAKTHFKDFLGDLYSCFVIRNLDLCRTSKHVGMITIPNWMYLATFQKLRDSIHSNSTIVTLTDNGRGVWGSDFGSCSFVLMNSRSPQYRGSYRKLFSKPGSIATVEELRQRFLSTDTFTASSSDFTSIPGSPVAYSATPEVLAAFRSFEALGTHANPAKGLVTLNDARFVRYWYEVSLSKLKLNAQNPRDVIASRCKWFPMHKGGDFRKWYGNNLFVINWEGNGSEVKNYIVERYGGGSYTKEIRNENLYFRPMITWSDVSISTFGVRRSEAGFLFSSSGPSACPDLTEINLITGFLCSSTALLFMRTINPTIHSLVGDIAKLPFSSVALKSIAHEIDCLVESAVSIAKEDWDAAELSWGFAKHPYLEDSSSHCTVQESESVWTSEVERRFRTLADVEAKNNEKFCVAYRMPPFDASILPDDQITLSRPDRTEDIKRLLSYAIGCMMGRYSLDKPGLIYAHSGNQGFDSSQYKTFRADDDGIIPLLETDWGIRDDGTNRFVEFISVAWPKERLEDNLEFVAESLGSNDGEQPQDTIRRYVATGLYKHHLSMYKKRPIYWLFSSGKQRAFQCLVYLHRYNEGTLARMRTEYVIPLQGKLQARIDRLEDEKSKADSTSARRKLQKQQDDLRKQQTELAAFEEKLKHAADQRITLDLDDGVKVNYAKFGDLLAESKAITGGRDEE